MRWGHVLLVYFLAGAMLWGGGLIGWGQAGLGTAVVDDPVNGTVANETSANVDSTQNVIQQTAQATGGGPLLAVVTFVGSFFEFVFWPFFVLGELSAPPRVQVTLGGAFVVAFLGAFIRFARGI